VLTAKRRSRRCTFIVKSARRNVQHLKNLLMTEKDEHPDAIPDYRHLLPVEEPVPADEAEENWNNKHLKPKEFMFLESYFDPESETFNNFKASADLAGFKGLSASNPPKWLKVAERHLKSKLVAKAESNLEKFLSMDLKKGQDIHTGLARIQADVAKFVAERLDKENYSEGNVMINLDI